MAQNFPFSLRSETEAFLGMIATGATDNDIRKACSRAESSPPGRWHKVTDKHSVRLRTDMTWEVRG